jgi:hypothetical protein
MFFPKSSLPGEAMLQSSPWDERIFFPFFRPSDKSLNRWAIFKPLHASERHDLVGNGKGITPSPRFSRRGQFHFCRALRPRFAWCPDHASRGARARKMRQSL